MKTKILFSTMLLFVFLTSNSQNILTVDNSVGSKAQYSDLNTAIALADPSDIIYVHPSEINYGNITITKELHLIGFAHSDPDKATLITNLIIGENASNSSFSGLRITGDFIVDNLSTTLTGLIFENNIVERRIVLDDAGVDDMLIRGNIISEIGTNNGGSSYNNYTNTIITNNIITFRIYVKNYQTVEVKNNLFLYSAGPIINRGYENGSITVQNSMFYNSNAGTLDPNSLGVIFSYCLAYNLGSGIFAVLNGDNNIENIDPLFVSADNTIFNPDIDDYHLQEGSIAIGNGVSGQDIGLYNVSPFVFNNFGYTNGIPTVKITAITNTVAIDGDVEVTITTKTN